MTSRRQRLVDSHDFWLAGLRAVLRKIAADGAHLVIAEGTAGADFVRRVADRLKIPTVFIAAEPNLADHKTDLPVQDLAVLASVDTIYVLSIRSEGNIHRLLRQHLEAQVELECLHEDGTDSDAKVQTNFRVLQPPAIVLVDLPGLCSAAIRLELCQSGATRWQPTPDQCAALQGSGSQQNRDMIPTANNQGIFLIVPFPRSDDWAFLSHTTRACPGPWPGESFDSYVDGLAESRSDADHSSLGTLRRILTQRLLLASNRTIRDGFQVVSLTACPLLELPKLHQFRSHRVRWDFEPYGICIRRNWLMKRGARPVIYGDEASWQSLPVEDRPYFQLAMGKSGIDWSIEHEWRHLGDLSLDQLTSDDILIFVPNFEAAKSVASVTDWPITLWPADETASGVKHLDP